MVRSFGLLYNDLTRGNLSVSKKEWYMDQGTWRVKAGLAQMLKGGVIMDVVSADQAKIAEDAGACAVMALERVPADIRADGGVARMADPARIKSIMKAVTIPVMAKCRIGHFVEAQVGEALRRIEEGAAMIRTKGEAGTGNIVEAVRHMRTVMGEIRKILGMSQDELMAEAKALGAPFGLVQEVHDTGRLPVVNFAAGGIATPADAALMMQLGAEGVFVGSAIDKSSNPEVRAKAVVAATTHYNDPDVIAKASEDLGEAMPGMDVRTMKQEEILAVRGW